MTTVVHPGDSLTPRQRLVYVLVLGALTALGAFTIDLYIPAFPVIEAEFDVPTTVIQLTLTATTLGFAAGQILVGPWSDRVGRRVPLIVATSVHVVASLGVVLAPSIEVLFVFRVLQGMGAAAGAVVAMAIVRDLFGGLPLVRMLSRLALVNGLAPILAPVIGSQLLLIVPWRGIFVFLTIYGGLVLLAAVFFVVETLPPARRIDLGHSTTRERYRNLFTDRVFVGVALIAGLIFSGIFAYLASATFLFQQVYGLDAQQFGLIFGVNSVGIMIGVQSSAYLTRYVKPQWILSVALVVMLVAAIGIVVVDSLGLGLVPILIPLFVFIMFCGVSFPCTQVIALANHGGEAATAASLLGAVNYGLAGLISPIVGLFGVSNAIPMAAIMAITAVTGSVILWTVVRPWRVPALSR